MSRETARIMMKRIYALEDELQRISTMLEDFIEDIEAYETGRTTIKTIELVKEDCIHWLAGFAERPDWTPPYSFTSEEMLD